MAYKPAMRIGANGNESRMPQRHLTGVTHQNHEPQTGNAHDEDVGELTHNKFGHDPGGQAKRYQ